LKTTKQFQARHLELHDELRRDMIQLCNTDLHGKVRDMTPWHRTNVLHESIKKTST